MRKSQIGFLIAMMPPLTVSAQESGLQLDCLFANTDLPPNWLSALNNCHSDPEKIAEYAEVEFAIKVLNISRKSISFKGCPSIPFAAKEYNISFDIFYPSDKNKTDYVVPLYHELAHIYQMTRFGGRGKALEFHGSLKTIELCSDLVAGFLMARSGKFHPQQFQQNLILRGNYRSAEQTFHGTPGERVNAFRYGYYTSGKSPDLNSQYDLALNRNSCNP